MIKESIISEGDDAFFFTEKAFRFILSVFVKNGLQGYVRIRMVLGAFTAFIFLLPIVTIEIS